jgi:hypothetical protein
MKNLMNNRPIDEYGFKVFSISHFECEARWRAGNLDDPYIEVKVYLAGGCTTTPIDRFCFPTTLTLWEIQREMANYVLSIIEEMYIAARRYHQDKE